MDYQTIVDNLKSHGFLPVFCPDRFSAADKVLELVGKQSVGIGGSITVRELDLFRLLQENGNKVHWHWEAGRESMENERKSANCSEVYLSSVNALISDGRLLNIDGTGNRVSGMIYGPETVIVVVGKNKIVDSVDEGIMRTRQQCCPENARRLGLRTPCAVTGKCEDCDSPQRMCNVISVHERAPRGFKAFYVVLVGEDLGL